MKTAVLLPLLVLISPFCDAQTTIFGKTGLIYVPTATRTDDGTFQFGYHYNPIRYGFRYKDRNSESISFINLTILPRLEVNVNLLQYNNHKNLDQKGIGDRQLDIKYLILTETSRRPALAAIISPPFGINSSVSADVLVATKTFKLAPRVFAEVTAGIGSPYFFQRGNKVNNDIFADMKLGKKKNLTYQYLSGPVGGVNLRLERRAGLMLEWDSQQFNMGIYGRLFKRWTVQAGLLNFDQITFGTSYALNLRQSAVSSQNRTDEDAVEPETDLSGPSERNKVLENFENITRDSSGTKIAYEQRLYRNPYRAIKQISLALPDSGIQEYIPMFQGVPIGAYRPGRSAKFRNLAGQELNVSDFPLTKYKLDFWLQPVFAANFGYKEKPIQSNASLLLQTQFFLAKGLAFNTGILFPITNDLDNRPKKIRLAPTYLNQFLAFGQNFVSASAGYFYDDQYGVNLQYRHQNFTNPWSFGLQSGITGLYYWAEKGIYYEKMDNMLLLADVAYRLPYHNITMQLSGGRYLAGDNGARLDLIRQFTNVEVGFYIMKTSYGTTAGFNFAVPIPPGKIIQGKRVRLRTNDEFRWEYAYTRGYRIGERYRTGYQLDQKLRQYYPNN
ncbi:hypothetical protein GCM10007423_00020 [Dyadobacter endophyticus]|uniref:Exopolysaccharide biosynthesis protein YbjH n=1 Tax=Dyadobacter endophyticus TaxID=1749036 RepID=A0ABQ1YC66_9BACT|nr:hypothetical protein GCM10007423_00020 [Dyadobacter endophyticus]